MTRPIQVIAEIAQGFEGSLAQARLLLRAAAAAGADAAKYQLVYADELASPDYVHYALFRSLEMPDEAWQELADYATQLGIELHLDIFGTRSLELAGRIGAATVKVHGTDLANDGLLTAVAGSAAVSVLLGAGGAHATEIDRALDILAGKSVVVLLGFQGYPTPDDTNQIARVTAMVEGLRRRHDRLRVGFADHANPETPLRYALAAAAVGAGAAVIEKHLTLARVMALEDHESALGPDEFAEFTRTIRGCAGAVGVANLSADDFGMSDAEKAYRAMIRRHVVASRDLPAGTTLAAADMVLKRTSAAQPLVDCRAVYGRRLVRGIGTNAPILAGDLDTE